MAYTPIDREVVTTNGFDGQPLSSAITTRLAENAQHNSRNRLKRHVITYTPTAKYDVQVSSGYPANDTGLEGFETLRGLSQTDPDPDAIGLTFSTPAQDLLVLPPILWPLSSRCNELKFTLDMAATNAEVEVFVYAKSYAGGTIGIPPASAVSLESGQIVFSAEAQASTQYKEVGTSTTSYSIFNPVEVSIQFPEAIADNSSMKRGLDSGGPVQLFIGFHSKQGSLDYTGKWEDGGLQFDGAVIQEGTFTYNSLALTTNKHNPASFHRWLKFTQTLGGFGNSTSVTATPFHHVVQLRPGDLADPTSADKAKYVIWPKMRDVPVWSDDAAIEIYECGIATINSITIQEISTP